VGACQMERLRRDRVYKSAGSAGLTKNMISKITPDRTKIILDDEDHVKYWMRHFGVTKDVLASAIERVGNSAAAVRKQLTALKAPGI
jgi:hypothetical protein